MYCSMITIIMSILWVECWARYDSSSGRDNDNDDDDDNDDDEVLCREIF